MAIIKPSDLPANTTPASTDVLVTEGATVAKSTIAEVMTAGRPFATQAEAETGTGTTQTMNPLATKQSIADEVGDTIQAHDDDLDAIAALTSAADKVPYATGSATWALADFTAAGRAVAGAADAAAQRTALGLGTAAVRDLIDEDDMVSNSATALPSQQSVKAYVDGSSANVILDEDDFASNSAVLAPSQQSTKAYVAIAMPVEEPADIAALTVDLTRPAINVLGYPTSPGARHDWVRVASEPAHPMKQQSLDGQWWAPSLFTIQTEHFGAWVGGSDVSATLQDAVDFALELDGGASLVMPAGDVYLETSITGALGGVARYLSLRGQGYESTRILLDDASGAGGIHFEQPTLDGTASVGHFRDFGIVMDGQGTFGTPALRWKRPEGGASHGRTFVLENVRVAGLAIATDYAGAGVDVSGAHHPLFKNYQFTGPWGPGVPGGDFSNTSIIYAAEYGINMDGTYQGEILDSQMWAARYMIYNRSAEPTGGEGIHISRTNMVHCRRGLWWERTGPEPSIWIDKCHINYRDHGLYIDGCRLGDITNNLIYQEDASGAAASAPIDVYLRNVLEMQLTDNRHHFAGDARRIPYQIDTADTYENNIEIIRPRLGSGSSFTNLAYIGAGAVDVQILDPNIPSGVVSGALLGGTGDASIRYTYPKPTQVRRTTSAQSIPDGLANAVAVSWNSEIDDPRGLWASGTPTQIIVPNRAGITKLRISTNIQWATNGVGVRQVFLKKNGVAFELGFSIQVPAGTGVNAQFAQSGWLPVADGNYFEVFVGQTSGGPLDVINSNNTWVSVEVA